MFDLRKSAVLNQTFTPSFNLYKLHISIMIYVKIHEINMNLKNNSSTSCYTNYLYNQTIFSVITYFLHC